MDSNFNGHPPQNKNLPSSSNTFPSLDSSLMPPPPPPAHSTTTGTTTGRNAIDITPLPSISSPPTNGLAQLLNAASYCNTLEMDSTRGKLNNTQQQATCTVQYQGNQHPNQTQFSLTSPNTINPTRSLPQYSHFQQNSNVVGEANNISLNYILNERGEEDNRESSSSASIQPGVVKQGKRKQQFVASSPYPEISISAIPPVSAEEQELQRGRGTAICTGRGRGRKPRKPRGRGRGGKAVLDNPNPPEIGNNNNFSQNRNQFPLPPIQPRHSRFLGVPAYRSPSPTDPSTSLIIHHLNKGTTPCGGGEGGLDFLCDAACSAAKIGIGGEEDQQRGYHHHQEQQARSVIETPEVVREEIITTSENLSPVDILVDGALVPPHFKQSTPPLCTIRVSQEEIEAGIMGVFQNSSGGTFMVNGAPAMVKQEISPEGGRGPGGLQIHHETSQDLLIPRHQETDNEEGILLDLRKPVCVEKLCIWCGKNPTIPENGGIESDFCSKLCFHMYRRDSFKKRSNCIWCSGMTTTRSSTTSASLSKLTTGNIGVIDESRFCSEECLNNYKVKLFCEETSAHLEQITAKNLGDRTNTSSSPSILAAAMENSASSSHSSSNGRVETEPTNNEDHQLITPDLWLNNNNNKRSNLLNVLAGGEQSSQSHSHSSTSNSPEEAGSRGSGNQGLVVQQHPLKNRLYNPAGQQSNGRRRTISPCGQLANPPPVPVTRGRPPSSTSAKNKRMKISATNTATSPNPMNPNGSPGCSPSNMMNNVGPSNAVAPFQSGIGGGNHSSRPPASCPPFPMSPPFHHHNHNPHPHPHHAHSMMQMNAAIAAMNGLGGFQGRKGVNPHQMNMSMMMNHLMGNHPARPPPPPQSFENHPLPHNGNSSELARVLGSRGMIRPGGPGVSMMVPTGHGSGHRHAMLMQGQHHGLMAQSPHHGGGLMMPSPSPTGPHGKLVPSLQGVPHSLGPGGHPNSPHIINNESGMVMNGPCSSSPSTSSTSSLQSPPTRTQNSVGSQTMAVIPQEMRQQGTNPGSNSNTSSTFSYSSSSTQTDPVTVILDREPTVRFSGDASLLSAILPPVLVMVPYPIPIPLPIPVLLPDLGQLRQRPQPPAAQPPQQEGNTPENNAANNPADQQQRQQNQQQPSFHGESSASLRTRRTAETNENSMEIERPLEPLEAAGENGSGQQEQLDNHVESEPGEIMDNSSEQEHPPPPYNGNGNENSQNLDSLEDPSETGSRRRKETPRSPRQ